MLLIITMFVVLKELTGFLCVGGMVGSLDGCKDGCIDGKEVGCLLGTPDG